MIASLYGRISALHLDRVVIDVGGVGLAVIVSPTTSTRLSVGNDAQLFTSLVVREDALTLYGFLDEASRITFDLVQTVSGVGPKVAMAILANMAPEDLGLAIAQENVAAIERVPGIGRKGAQRLILELKGKIAHVSDGYPVGHLPIWREQLISALISLGFSAREADVSIGGLLRTMQLEKEDPASVEVSELLRRALQRGARGN